MKKNVVGHMMATKESVSTKIHRWNIWARIVCLLLALVVWLLVANLNTAEAEEPTQPVLTSEQS